jgi:hypothetical protein
MPGRWRTPSPPAAEVGGNNVFRPARLAGELRGLEVVNVGAAGTFAVRGAAWSVKVERVEGRLALGLWRCLPGGFRAEGRCGRG